MNWNSCISRIIVQTSIDDHFRTQIKSFWSSFRPFVRNQSSHLNETLFTKDKSPENSSPLSQYIPRNYTHSLFSLSFAVLFHTDYTLTFIFDGNSYTNTHNIYNNNFEIKFIVWLYLLLSIHMESKMHGCLFRSRTNR